MVARAQLISAIAAIAALVLSAGAPAARGEATNEGCPKVILYFARGSSQTMSETTSGFGRPGQELLEALEQRYQPGVVGTMADAYPAVPALNVFIGRYFPSAENGAQAAVYNSEDLSLLCPSSWLVLGGYSQGAQAIRTALATIDEVARERIAAVVLFGDPYFDPSEENVLALSSVDRRGGLLHRGSLRNRYPSRAPKIGVQWQGRVFSWCHAGDLVCQTIGTTASHYTYDENAGEAAGSIVKRLGEVGLAPELMRGGTALAVPYRVQGTCITGTCGLAVWSGPGTSAFKATGAVHEGQQIPVICQARGQRMLGPSGRDSAIWDRLASGGFVSDLYVNTPAVGRFSGRLALCTGLAVGAASGAAK